MGTTVTSKCTFPSISVSHFRMPLEKNGRPWVLAEFPDEIEEDDAIFRIRFTGEVCSVGTRWHGLLSSCVTNLSYTNGGMGVQKGLAVHCVARNDIP